MVRLSNFVFPTTHPPRSISKPFEKRLVHLNIPGKNGTVMQDMGSDNMKITLNGSLYNIPTDTDKRRTDMNSLMTLAMANNPMTFTNDADHPCGEDGDNWSEYSGTTAMDVDWTHSGLNRAVGATTKVGSHSIELTSPASGTMTLDNISEYNLNLPEYSALCFWLYTNSATATNDDITVKCYTTNTSHYYYRVIDASTDFDLSNWYEIVLPVGSGASTATAGVDGWTSSGSPDWTSIDGIQLSWGASAAGTISIDGFCLTHAVLFNGIPQFTYSQGNPNRYDYNMNLIQYLQ